MGRALLAVFVLIFSTVVNADETSQVAQAQQAYDLIIIKVKEQLAAARVKEGRTAPTKAQLEEIDAIRAKAVAAAEALSEEIQNAELKFKPTEREIAKLSKKDDAATDGSETFKRLAELKERLKNSREALQDRQTNLSKIAAAKESATLANTKMIADAGLDEKTAQETIAKLKAHVERLALDSSISNVTNGLENLGGQVGNLLMALEARVDNTMAGMYTREKLARFASSPAFCDAQKACTEGKPMPFDDVQKAFDDEKSRMFFNKDGQWGGKRAGGAKDGATHSKQQ